MSVPCTCAEQMRWGVGRIAGLLQTGCSLLFLSANQCPEILFLLYDVPGAQRWWWALRNVLTNKHDEKSGLLPGLTCCLPGHQDSQSMYLLYEMVKVHNCVIHFLFSIWHTPYNLKKQNLRSNVLCVGQCLAVNSFLGDKIPSAWPHSSRGWKEQKQNSGLEWMGFIETFRDKLYKRESWSLLKVLLALHVS